MSNAQPLDILMISYWDFQSHGMQVTTKTPLYFARQGHQVTFMVHSETTAKPTPITDLHPNVDVLRFEMPLKWLNRLPVVRRLRQLVLFAICCLYHARRRYRRGCKPDVIYAAEADAVLIGALLRWIYRVPLVTRFYGIARINEHFDQTRNRLARLRLRHLASQMAMTRTADMMIITNDGTSGEQVARALNPHVKNIQFWPNGVDRGDVAPQVAAAIRARHDIAANETLLMTLCRLEMMKRVDRAIRVAGRLKTRGRHGFKLLVVGHGPDREDLERLAAREDVTDRVLFAGAVEHSRVADYYAAADIFLSLYDMSNVGNPLWESMAAGKCLVALNTGGTGAVVQDGINGRLVDVDGGEEAIIERLTDVVDELLADAVQRQRLARGARQYADANLWSWDERLRTELDAITALVGRDHVTAEDAEERRELQTAKGRG